MAGEDRDLRLRTRIEGIPGFAPCEPLKATWMGVKSPFPALEARKNAGAEPENCIEVASLGEQTGLDLL